MGDENNSAASGGASVSWFESDEVLLALAKREHRASGPPEIPGYDQLAEVHRGGQGVVYRAVQRSTRQAVAIKVLLGGSLASAVQLRRFEREAELAAGLVHPNIVRVFDRGVTPQGWPYIVMEFVEGPALNEYLHGRGVDAREVVDLFRRVGTAVAFAHQRGVIHRDLKPGNIRVDERGEPRILDFGLAKSMLEREAAPVSTTGQFLGSLPWASPEQTLGRPDALDVRTDVYAIGVMLYEALCGASPYDTSGDLSRALANIRETSPQVPRGRGVDGDLSTIVMTCLAKEPDRRYQTAAGLVEDLEAWAAGMPIGARRDSAWYTLRKTAHRYRRAAWFGGVGAAVVSAALVLAVMAARQAIRERDIAQQQADKATAVSAFVERMLASPDPSKEGKDVRVAEVLDAAAREVDRALQGRARSQAAVRNTLGTSYFQLGMFEASLAQHKAAEATGLETLGADSDEVLTARNGAASAMVELGKAKEALEIAQAVVEARVRLNGPEGVRTLDAKTTLGTCLDAVGRTAEAERLKRETAEAYERIVGLEDPGTILALNNLAVCLHGQGKDVDATAVLERVLDAQTKARGSRSPEAIMTATNLAAGYKVLNRVEDAQRLLKDAYEAAGEVWGPDHNETLIIGNNWADLLMKMGKLTEAEPIFLSVLEARKRVSGARHEKTLGVMSNIGTLYRNKGEPEKAEPYMREAADAAEAVIGPDNRYTLVMKSNYAELLDAYLHRGAEASVIYDTVVSRARAKLGEGNWITGAMEHNYAKNLKGLGKLDDAAAHARAGFEILNKTLGPAHDRTTSVAQLMAGILEAQGKTDEAAEWAARGKAAAK